MAENQVALEKTPYELLGGLDAIRTLVTHFYDHMDAHEPALARLHELDEQGRVSPAARERFTKFLAFWLGGPNDYLTQHGHPALRRRHAKFPVGVDLRDAWIRSMTAAMNECRIDGPVRAFLDWRFTEVADFLRNVPEAQG